MSYNVTPCLIMSYYVIHLRSASYDKQDPCHTCNPCVSFHSLHRNKRCVLAYLQYRLDKIQRLRWETGAILPDNISHLLSSKEVEYFLNYDMLLAQYMKTFNIDLTAVSHYILRLILLLILISRDHT